MREFLHLDATDVLGLALCSVLRESIRSLPDTSLAAASDPPGPSPTWRWQPKSASRQLPPAESHGFKGCPWGGMHPREVQATGSPKAAHRWQGWGGRAQQVPACRGVTEPVDKCTALTSPPPQTGTREISTEQLEGSNTKARFLSTACAR